MLKKIANAFVFVIVGIITIIVGAFMLRGTMHLWDRKKDKDKDDDK